eukprot:5918987-Ditylum_brightwellii.AAC.1
MDYIIDRGNERIACYVGEKIPNPFSASDSVANVNAYAGIDWVLLAVTMMDLVISSTLFAK